jgi:probable HAF family extracellular repeat protein
MNKKQRLSITLLGVLVASQAMATTYTFKTIDAPVPQSMYELTAADINDNGKIVGSYFDNANNQHGFVYDVNTFSTLDVPGEQFTGLSSINASGKIVVNSTRFPYDIDLRETVSYLYSGGIFSPFIYPDVVKFIALYGINASGQMIGQADIDNPCGSFCTSIHREGILVSSDGIKTTLPGAPRTFNNKGQIVGKFIPESGGPFYTPGFFLYDTNSQQTRTLIVPDSIAVFDEPRCINDNGQVVGQYSLTSPSDSHGFLFHNDVFTKLDVPGGTNTDPKWINNSGQVVGYYNSGTSSHGFVYDAGIYTSLDVPNAVSTFPSKNNASGQIVGTYLDNAGLVHGFIATPATKPTSIKDCKNGGWKKFVFKNQGLCEKYVNNLK